MLASARPRARAIGNPRPGDTVRSRVRGMARFRADFRRKQACGSFSFSRSCHARSASPRSSASRALRPASAATACAIDADGNGYTYAGHQASVAGHGVRATITPTRALNVAAGHVAGWVGVGGPGQGANGEDAWLQVGIASVEGTAPYLYAEVVRDGRQPQLMLLDEDLRVGVSRRVAVLETAERPGSWRVWVDGNPVTKPIHLRGSSGRWAPIATAESFNGGESGMQQVRVPLRAGLGLLRPRRLVAPVRARVPLPGQRPQAAVARGVGTRCAAVRVRRVVVGASWAGLPTSSWTFT